MTAFPARRLHLGLALARLALIFAILCFLVLQFGLALRAIWEAGWGLATSLPPAHAPGVQIPFAGVNVALEQYPSAVQRRRALARLREAHFGWVRQRLDWGEMEPAPGDFQWQRSDALIQDIVDSGLVPVLVLDGSPAWARSPLDQTPTDNPFAPPAAPEAFARFAAAFAQRYAKQVRFYQIWDEPNVAPHWGNHHIDPVAYARLLKTSSLAIRGVDADAVILLAALAPTADRGHTAIDEVHYLQRIYAADGAPYFDAVAVEPFGFGYSPRDRRQAVQILNFWRAALVRRTMLAAGDGQTPIWAVRFGWNDRSNPNWRAVSPSLQRQFAQEALVLARRAWPWMAAMAWAIDRPALPPNDPLWGFALVTPSGQSRPLLQTFTTIIPQLETIERIPPAFARFSAITLWRRPLLLLLAAVLLIWRAGVAARSLPWVRWRDRYNSWPRSRQLLTWAGLLGVYYLATWPPLIVFCWLVAALLIAVQPRVGVWLMAALLPFHTQHKALQLVDTVWLVPPAQAALLCTVPALFGALRARWSSKQGGRFPGRFGRGLDWLAWAWLLVNLASVVHVWHWPAYVAGLWSLALVPLLFYLAVRLWIVTAEERNAVAIALAVGGMLAALIGLGQWMAGSGVSVDGTRRLLGLTFSPNQTALYLERTLFLVLGLAIGTGERRWRRVWLSGGILLSIGLALTASRGAWFLGVPAGVAILAGMSWPVYAPTIKRTARIWLPLGLAGFAILLMGLGSRLGNSTSIFQRFSVWQGAEALWQTYPFFGVGPNGFFWRYPAYMMATAADEPRLLHPHNLWLEFATGWGVLGLIWLSALLLALGQLVRRTYRLPVQADKWLSAGLLAGLAAGLAHAQVDAYTVLPELAGWNWMILALLASAAQSLQRGHEK